MSTAFGSTARRGSAVWEHGVAARRWIGVAVLKIALKIITAPRQYGGVTARRRDVGLAAPFWKSLWKSWRRRAAPWKKVAPRRGYWEWSGAAPRAVLAAVLIPGEQQHRFLVLSREIVPWTRSSNIYEHFPQYITQYKVCDWCCKVRIGNIASRLKFTFTSLILPFSGKKNLLFAIFHCRIAFPCAQCALILLLFCRPLSLSCPPHSHIRHKFVRY